MCIKLFGEHPAICYSRNCFICIYNSTWIGRWCGTLGTWCIVCSWGNEVSLPSRITLKTPCGFNLVQASGVMVHSNKQMRNFPVISWKVNAAKSDKYVCSLHQTVNWGNLKATKMPSTTTNNVGDWKKHIRMLLWKSYIAYDISIHYWVSTWPSWAVPMKANKPETGLSMDWQLKCIYLHFRLTTKQYH